ncbi:MAG: hypothetical protein JXA14_20930, partial [Anaerolineae bacterium]|nr:hypothetical protein [Anaerolineae bacterium]
DENEKRGDQSEIVLGTAWTSNDVLHMIPFAIEQRDGMLAPVISSPHEFVQNLAFLFLAGSTVACFE